MALGKVIKSESGMAPTGYAVLPRGFSNVHYEKRPEGDMTEFIEHILPVEIAEAVYESDVIAQWFRDNDVDMLDYGAGVRAISVRMMADIPVNVYEKVKYVDRSGRTKNITKVRAKTIKQQIDDAICAEP